MQKNTVYLTNFTYFTYGNFLNFYFNYFLSMGHFSDLGSFYLKDLSQNLS